MTTKSDQDARYWLTHAGYDAIDDAPVTPQIVAVPLLQFPPYRDKPRASAS